MIGPSIKIKGEVTGDEDLVIQGSVDGTISLKAHAVSVGESGKVSADINAKSVKIDGEVNGDITGTENVMVSKLGNVRGNIISPRVTLEDGAVFKGSIDMDPGETATRAPAASTRAAAKEPSNFPPQGDTGAQLDRKSG